ncbi:MAG TPA: efflux RND transporter periplasmic adaptor subunit [Pirellulales bacterium]|jgi:RND family efflux transporter MFP subunit|nr:efflux RND transporter periplasmic adaptor subunit [Pirellulales bacterium]
MQKILRQHWLSLSGLALAAVVAVTAYSFSRGARHAAAAKETNAAKESVETTEQAGDRNAVRVEVVRPVLGGIVREITRPASVIAFESADLYAKISGYLKSQPVDIGSRVKQGETLAEIDAPEFAKQVEQAKAALDQANAQVAQAESRIVTAEAERDAAVAYVKQAEAEVDRALAARDYRRMAYERIEELVKQKAIDEKLRDEKLEEMNASVAAVLAARAGVVTAQAKVSAAEATIAQAKADYVGAKANVEVAQAALDKAKVFVDFTKIVSPYDGVVTKRNFFRGAFIRAAEQGGIVPLLGVSRVDLMRVVAQVPDRDVPYVAIGNPAKVEIDALPGDEFEGKVSRMADAEDPETRTMRVEIDLPNPAGTLREGMYGSATIHLVQGKKVLTIPSSCLVGNVDNGKGSVYIVENGVARAREVSVGTDNGVNTEIVKGLSEKNEVVYRHSGAVADGTAVEVIPAASER